MRLVIQRVTQASVTINNELYSSINEGLLILAGMQEDDCEEDVLWLASKVCGLRIFDDPNGVMNLSVKEIDGEILAVSQFTLMARTKKGNRPSYIDAARPELSIPIYERFLQALSEEMQKEVKKGVFGANMKVELLNNGPVTILIDSKNRQ